MKGLLGRKVGL